MEWEIGWGLIIAMQKYFYKAAPLVRKTLFNQLQLVNLEQEYFRGAVLAGLNNNPLIDPHELYQSIMNFTLQQQTEYSKANHLEQIFKHFNVLHRYKRNMQMVRNDAEEIVRDLVDPDKFPITDLSYKIPMWRSNWGVVEEKLKKKIGFLLRVKESSLRHADSGRGVFVETKTPNSLINTGTLLGFVPGSIFECSKEQNTYHNRTNTRVQYIHFTDNKILDLSKIKLPGIDQELEAHFKNPYAVGEYINHPPPRESSNVIFQQMRIPATFFIKQLLEFLPYQYPEPIEKYKEIPAFGIFNTTPIKDGSELFVNYLDHHIYPIDNIPQWLIEPAPLPPILQKNQYQTILPVFWSAMESKALEYHKELYEKYKKRVKYEPSRVMYEFDKKQYRELVKIKYNSFKEE